MNKRTLADIYQNEMNPVLYIKRKKEIRRRKIEEVVGGFLLLAILALTFTVVQVAYGIW